MGLRVEPAGRQWRLGWGRMSRGESGSEWQEVSGGLVLLNLEEDRFRGRSHHLLVLDQTPLGLEAEMGREGV